MTLIKTSLLNAIAVVVRILSMLVLNKVLAVYIGPSGYAVVGQLQNIITTLTAVASAGVGTGVTKYTAEYGEERPRQLMIWRTAGCTGAIGALLIAAIVIVFHRPLASYLLHDESYGNVFIWISICLLLFVFNTLLLSILNGTKDIRRFVLANIANSLIALAVTGVLAWQFGLTGALVALSINQSVACIATILICRKLEWFSLGNLFGRPDKATVAKLSHYTAMAIVTSVVGPIALMLIRDNLISDVGATAAGYWDAVNRISSIFLMLITTPLSVYYLPKLAEVKHAVGIKKEIWSGLKLLVPVTVFGAVVIYVSKEIWIKILFSKDFLPLTDILFYQLCGDVMRIIAWLFSFYLISKSLTRQFVTIEILVNITYVVLSCLFIEKNGVKGATIAYFANNVLYVIILIPCVLRNLNIGRNGNE